MSPMRSLTSVGGLAANESGTTRIFLTVYELSASSTLDLAPRKQGMRMTNRREDCGGGATGPMKEVAQRTARYHGTSM
jgi:hypothetical protein